MVSLGGGEYFLEGGVVFIRNGVVFLGGERIVCMGEGSCFV